MLIEVTSDQVNNPALGEVGRADLRRNPVGVP